MEQHLLEIIKANISQVEEVVDVTEIVEELIAEPAYKIASNERIEYIVQKQKGDSECRLIEARMKRKSNKSKNLLDSLLQDPSSLINKRVKHKIQETKEDIAEWYDATVVTLTRTILKIPYKQNMT